MERREDDWDTHLVREQVNVFRGCTTFGTPTRRPRGIRSVGLLHFFDRRSMRSAPLRINVGRCRKEPVLTLARGVEHGGSALEAQSSLRGGFADENLVLADGGHKGALLKRHCSRKMVRRKSCQCKGSCK